MFASRDNPSKTSRIALQSTNQIQMQTLRNSDFIGYVLISSITQRTMDMTMFILEDSYVLLIPEVRMGDIHNSLWI